MKWIFNNWKAIGIIALIIAAIAGCLFARHFYNLLQAEKEKQTLIAASDSGFAVKPTAKFTDTSGHHHFIIKSGSNTFIQSTIKQNPKISLGGADTVALALKIQREQIQYWMNIATTSQAKALKANSMRDSLGKLIKFYKDKYIEIAYNPGKDSTDNGTFDYKKYEQLSVLQYWKRDHFLGPRNSYMDISSNDPHTVITGTNTFTVKQDPNPFSLRAQLKSTYDFPSGRLFPSLGLIATYRNYREPITSGYDNNKALFGK